MQQSGQADEIENEGEEKEHNEDEVFQLLKMNIYICYIKCVCGINLQSCFIRVWIIWINWIHDNAE